MNPFRNASLSDGGKRGHTHGGKKDEDRVPAHSRDSGLYVVSASDEPAVSTAVSETVVSIGAVFGPCTTGLCTDAQPDAINDATSTNKIGTLTRISPVQKNESNLCSDKFEDSLFWQCISLKTEPFRS